MMSRYLYHWEVGTKSGSVCVSLRYIVLGLVRTDPWVYLFVVITMYSSSCCCVEKLCIVVFPEGS